MRVVGKWECEHTVDSWYQQGYGSKDATIEKLQMLSRHGVQCCTASAWFIFSITLPPGSTRETLLFNRSKIFTLSLQLSTLTVTLLFWVLFAFREADFHRIIDRKTLSRLHNYLNTTVIIGDWLPFDCMYVWMYCTWSKQCVINPQRRQSYCIQLMSVYHLKLSSGSPFHLK
jgi:hypothetical protein